MTNRFFHLTAFVLLTVASHLAYILLSSGSHIEERALDFASLNGVNQFAAPDHRAALKHSLDAGLGAASVACVYDLKDGPLQLSVPIVGPYWSLTIYSLKGDVLYTLNDRQADSPNVEVRVLHGNASSDEIAAGKQENRPDQSKIVSPDRQGLIVLRALADLPGQKNHLAEELSASRCRA